MKCTKVRATRAARSVFLNQPIVSFIFCGVNVVVVVIAKGRSCRFSKARASANPQGEYCEGE